MLPSACCLFSRRCRSGSCHSARYPILRTLVHRTDAGAIAMKRNGLQHIPCPRHVGKQPISNRVNPSCKPANLRHKGLRLLAKRMKTVRLSPVRSISALSIDDTLRPDSATITRKRISTRSRRRPTNLFSALMSTSLRSSNRQRHARRIQHHRRERISPSQPPELKPTPRSSAPTAHCGWMYSRLTSSCRASLPT